MAVSGTVKGGGGSAALRGLPVDRAGTVDAAGPKPAGRPATLRPVVRHRRRPSLWLVAAVLIMTAAGGGTALYLGGLLPAPLAAVLEKYLPGRTSPVETTGPVEFLSPAPDYVREYEEELETMRAELAVRQETLDRLEAELGEKNRQLEAMARDLERRRMDLRYLAALYQEMKSQEAAAILDHLDDDLVAGILAEADRRTAARILAAMNPKRAAALTVRLNGERR